jgi:hypothetical protein
LILESADVMSKEIKILLKSNHNSIGRLATHPCDSKLGWNVAIVVPYKNINKSVLKPGYVYDLIELNGAVFLQELGESYNTYDAKDMIYNQDCLLTADELKDVD